MKLLFDHNLSPRLVQRLDDLYSDATHVSFVSLDRSTDLAVWAYARTHDCVIVTKDSDFSDIAVLRGFPPKAIWLRLGNCTTADIERLMRRGHQAILAFSDDPFASVLELL